VDDGEDESGGVVHHHVHHHHYKDSHSDKHPQLVDVSERLEYHPQTWVNHLGSREGALKIVQLEMNELLDAIQTNSEEHICKELTDLSAACIYALKMK